MIPKTVHRCWLGPHSMPAEYRAYADSWRDHGFDVIEWTEANLPDLVNQHIYDDPNIGSCVGGGVPETGKWVQQADVVSYELLWRFGGLYADTDMECRRDFDALLAGVTAFAGFEEAKMVGTALMGSVKHHPFFRAVIDALPVRYEGMPDTPMNVVTGPHLLTAISEERGDLTVFPQRFFYPFGYGELDQEHDDHPDAYAVHHWGHKKWPRTAPSDAASSQP